MEIRKQYSSGIENGFVSRRSNLFFEKFISILFSRIDFDSETLATLNEFIPRGRIAYISFQSSNTSLLILTTLLRRYGFKVPELAIDYSPYLFQKLSSLIKKIIRFFNVFSGKERYEKVEDSEYIKSTLSSGSHIILSLLSRKAFLKRYMEIKIDALQYIIEVQKTTDEPIYLLPQIMFWNRNPERTKGVVTSKATGDRGIFSALFTMFKSATPSFMRISMPVNVKEEIEASESDDSRQIARRIRNKMLEIYNHEKRSILGPVIKSQQEMMEKVLYHKNVLDTISELVVEENRSKKKQRQKAYKYFREIAADFSIIYIRFFEKSLDYIFNKIFDGIYYSLEDFKKIREASQKGPLILMPSHKSHMDYLILSSIFYRNKIIPPHIVAGSNLTFFPMGKIFRRSGAFFMRRSFKGLKLYAAVFKQYIKTLVNEGYSIEFFIEGGRTRTGKLVFPKMGILKYLIEAVEEGYNKDLVFVPTSINYDRILEESSYQKELKGREKKSESTSNFVKSRKLLKRKYGRVYLSFNEPVTYQELKERFQQPIDELTISIGDYVVKRINEIIMVTPFAVTSAAILLSSLKGFSREIIRARINLLLDYFDSADIQVSDTMSDRSNVDEIIDYALQSFKEDKIVKELELDQNDKSADPDLYIINEEDRARINFYKNSIIHFTLPAGFCASIINRYADSGPIPMSLITEKFAELKELFSDEFVYMDHMNDVPATVMKTIEFLASSGIVTRENDSVVCIADRKNEIIFLSKMIQDIMESYLIVFSTAEHMSRTVSLKDLISDIRKKGIKMYHLGESTLSEALSMPSYNCAVSYLTRTSILLEKPGNKRDPDLKMINLQKLKEVNEELKAYLVKMIYFIR